MGNSDIRDLAYIEEADQSEVAGYRVAVDASNWLYRYMTTTARFTNSEAYTNNDGVKLTNLIGVPRGVRKFFQINVQPVFVFDGAPSDMKEEEIKERKEKRQSATKKAEETDDAVESSKYESRSQQLSNDVISTTKKVLDLLDVPYTTAPQAAESQAAYMSQSDEFEAIVSDDYDSLVFGATTTIRNFTTSKDQVELMKFKETLEKHGFEHKHLILATILCGTDYNDGVNGVGPKTAIKKVKENPSLDELRDELGVDIERGERIFELYSKPKVKQEWPESKVSNPDTSAVRDYLESQGIDVSEVQKALDDIDESSSQTGLNAF